MSPTSKSGSITRVVLALVAVGAVVVAIVVASSASGLGSNAPIPPAKSLFGN